MQFIQGNNIGLILQLIKPDNTYEEDATVTYDIYTSDMSTVQVSGQSATWNDTFNCYHDELDINTDWLNQVPGNYILKWSVSNTTSFPPTMIENIAIIQSSESIADTVWDEELSGHLVEGTFGNHLKSISPSGEYYLDIEEIKTNLLKLLGLNHENIYMDQPQFDNDENLVSLRIRTYSNSLSVGTSNNVIATYRVTSEGAGSGKFTYWKQVLLI